MDYEIRPIREGETQRFRNAIARGFGGDSREEDHDSFYSNLPLDRTIAAFDGDQIVGTFGEFDFEVSVPGGATVAMAGTTIVTVRPTHRRRGILKEMMHLHLETVAGRGDPLAGLWTSEPSIYGRFGFGSAVDSHELNIDVRTVTLPDGPGDVRIDIVEDAKAKEMIPAVYERARMRAGMLSRTEAWWERRFYDPEHWRDGASARRYAVARRGDDVAGYVMYRQREKWEDEISNGKISIIELIADDRGARRALWSFLTHIDLFPNVNWWNAAIDEPLVWEASNHRRVGRRIADTLWLRILDVAAVLEARAYETDGRLVLAVRDDFGGYAAGTYELEIADGTGTVRVTDEPAELTLDVQELGSLYLGGRSAHSLWRAGRIDGNETAVRIADRVFRTVVAPWCPEIF